MLAIVLDMLFHSLALYAAAVLLQFLTYLRPGELMSIGGADLIPPVASSTSHMSRWAVLLHPSDPETLSDPSKVGERDESLLIDAPGWEAMDVALSDLKKYAAPSGPVWPFSQEDYSHQVALSVNRCQLGHLDIVPYSFRHAGASHDFARGVPLSTIKARGRWKADVSVARYAKPARAQQSAHQLDSNLSEFVIANKPLLLAIFSGLLAAPRPPWV